MATEDTPRIQWGRARKRWAIIGCICLLVVAFFVPGWGSHGGRLASYSHDLAHFPAFATIAAGLLSLVRRGRSALLKAGCVVLMALFIAMVIEFVQPYFGRTKDFNDWLLGAAGALAAAAIYMAFKVDSLHHRRLFVLLAGVALLACTLPLILMTADWYLATRAFPMLDSFERSVEMGRWKPDGCTITRSPEHVTHGRYALKVEVDQPGVPYPSVFLADGPMDWSGYSRFAVDVFLACEGSRVVWIRADDEVNPPYEKRAQMSVELKPGMNTIWVDLDTFARMPGGARLKMDHIQTVGLFLDHPELGDSIYVDRMILSARTKR